MGDGSLGACFIGSSTVAAVTTDLPVGRARYRSGART
jgi:hypothetical protein